MEPSGGPIPLAPKEPVLPQPIVPVAEPRPVIPPPPPPRPLPPPIPPPPIPPPVVKPAPATPKAKGGWGAIIAIFLIVALIITAAFYSWGERLATEQSLEEIAK
ncbi:MAG TPA: hypothetical protein VEA36_02110 [Candidatus Paceibacterota bacterium]|nr:hypothetical protein [Candidatus Paceibacterota bacterium]